MASKKDVQRGPICTTMTSAPFTSIAKHGNVKMGIETANGPTQAAMVPIKATPAGISSPMGDAINFKKSIGRK